MSVYRWPFSFRLLATIIFIFLCNSLNAATYSIGTEDIEYYPHYGKTSEESYGFEGYARLFFDDFSIKKDVSIEYIPQPVKRLYLNFIVKQSIDFKYPDSPQWNSIEKTESNRVIYYSKPIVSYLDGVFVHKDNANFTLDEINTLGIIRGFTPEPFLNEVNSNKIHLFEFSRSDHLLKALEFKRIDAIYINIDVAKFQMKNYKISGLIFRKDLPSTKGTYHISTLKHPEIITLIDQYIIENSLHIRELKNKLQLTY